MLDSLADEDTMWYRDMVPLYDTFEPEYIQVALESDLPLGELIFGPTNWVFLGGKPGIEDPLTQYFGKHGMRFFFIHSVVYCSISLLDLLHSNTFLRPDHYTSLFPPPEPKQIRSSRTTFTFKTPTKQLWSITQCFPSNSLARHGAPG